MKTTSIKLKQAIDNAEQFIAQMKYMDDKKLGKNLILVQKQMEMAFNNKNEKAYNLLCEYERQIIEARVLKLG